MFKPHKGICTKCHNERLIVVRAGWCGWCNEKQKDEKKANKIRIEKDENILPTSKDLKHEMDIVFSLFIRLRHADKKGMVECFTSGVKLHYTKAEAGHFIPRGNMSTRWDEQNVQVQSFDENRGNNGNPKVFAERLDEVYGIGTADALRKKKNDPFEPLQFYLQVKITHYRNLVDELLTKLKTK